MLVAACMLDTIEYRGKSITGYIVDAVQCPLPLCALNRTFTQADGIGLVAYESKSSSQSICLGGAVTSEQWTLVDYRAANQWSVQIRSAPAACYAYALDA